MRSDTACRTIIQLAVDERTLDTLISFDANAFEEQGEDRSDADDEVDGVPVVRDMVRPKVIRLTEAAGSASRWFRPPSAATRRPRSAG